MRPTPTARAELVRTTPFALPSPDAADRIVAYTCVVVAVIALVTVIAPVPASEREMFRERANACFPHEHGSQLIFPKEKHQ